MGLASMLHFTHRNHSIYIRASLGKYFALSLTRLKDIFWFHLFDAVTIHICFESNSGQDKNKRAMREIDDEKSDQKKYIEILFLFNKMFDRKQKQSKFRFEFRQF